VGIIDRYSYQSLDDFFLHNERPFLFVSHGRHRVVTLLNRRNHEGNRIFPEYRHLRVSECSMGYFLYKCHGINLPSRQTNGSYLRHDLHAFMARSARSHGEEFLTSGARIYTLSRCLFAALSANGLGHIPVRILGTQFLTPDRPRDHLRRGADGNADGQSRHRRQTNTIHRTSTNTATAAPATATDTPTFHTDSDKHTTRD